MWRNFLRLCVILGLALGAHFAMTWASARVETGGVGMRFGLLALFLLIYVILIAIPFVPGVEIGLSLMMIEGPWIAPFIYISTVCGLSLAYAAGQFLPYDKLHDTLVDLRLHRLGKLLEALQPMTRDMRLEYLRNHLPAFARPFLTKFRYLLLAVLVNIPGNTVIGGGGGILFTAGFSRLFRPTYTVLTVALAAAPVPFLVWGFKIDLMWFLQ